MLGQYYFLKNRDWFRADDKKGYVLTDKAPAEAKESYEKYLKDRKEQKKLGWF